jgi:hypothetical protein
MASAPICASLLNFIITIILIGANEYVVWSNALLIVAMVARPHAIWWIFRQ